MRPLGGALVPPGVDASAPEESGRPREEPTRFETGLEPSEFPIAEPTPVETGLDRSWFRYGEPTPVETRFDRGSFLPARAPSPRARPAPGDLRGVPSPFPPQEVWGHLDLTSCGEPPRKSETSHGWADLCPPFAAQVAGISDMNQTCAPDSLHKSEHL